MKATTDDTPTMLIAAEVRKLLFLRDMTMTQLADRAGMTQPYISRRLTGATTLDVDDLHRIADALDVEMADLLPARRESTRYSLPDVESASHAARTADPRPGHAAPALTARPTSHPIIRPSSGGADSGRDRRPARVPAPRDGSHR